MTTVIKFSSLGSMKNCKEKWNKEMDYEESDLKTYYKGQRIIPNSVLYHGSQYTV